MTRQQLGWLVRWIASNTDPNTKDRAVALKTSAAYVVEFFDGWSPHTLAELVAMIDHGLTDDDALRIRERREREIL